MERLHNVGKTQVNFPLLLFFFNIDILAASVRSPRHSKAHADLVKNHVSLKPTAFYDALTQWVEFVNGTKSYINFINFLAD